MKPLWIDVRPYSQDYINAAIESSVQGVILPKGYSTKVKRNSRILTIAADGDLRLGQDVFEIQVTEKNEGDICKRLETSKRVIVTPDKSGNLSLENLVAYSSNNNLFVKLSHSNDVIQVVNIMDKGPYGIVLKPNSLEDINIVVQQLHCSEDNINLRCAKITRIENIGRGDRVFVDTVTMMNLGEGMLIGNTTRGYFLVHSESINNPYTGQRPFRVNAGAVHEYICMPNDKKKYLAELEAGDNALIVDNRGNTRISTIGRAKIESRPLVLVEAEYQNNTIQHFVQDVACVYLLGVNGKPISVPSLKQGMKVLVYPGDGEGRHLGVRINEKVEEN